MHVAKLITTSVTGIALAFSMLASTLPANAATGFHAAYFSESNFLASSPGQSGQFAVGYTNTGDQAWVKGAANQQANLGTAAPLDNTTDFTAGWANGWLSANRYTAQNASLVAPGQIGFFIYNFTVPANAAAGEHRFYGRPVIDGVTYLEDYGYYQSVTVTATTLTATTTPASPSNNTTPTVSGTGAPAAGTVTVAEGTTTLCTAVADSSGNYACTTTALATGSHTITVSASNGAVQITYVVDNTKPTITTAGNTTPVKVMVTWSKAVSTGTTGGGGQNLANYNLDATAIACPAGGVATWTGGQNPTGASQSADGTQVTLTFPTALVPGSGHTINTCYVTDTAGNSEANPTSFAFLAVATPPSLTSASATAGVGAGSTSTSTKTVAVKWNQTVNCTAAGVYSVDNIAATGSGVAGSTCTITTSQSLSAGTTHTLTAVNETNGTSTQSPNPSSVSFTVAAQGTLTIASVAQGTNSEKSVDTTFSTTVSGGGNASPSTYTLFENGVALANCTLTAGASSSTLGGGACAVDATNAAIVHFTYTAVTNFTLGHTFQIAGETSTSGAAQNPNPYSTAVTLNADTTAPTLVSASSNAAATALTLTFSKCIALGTGGATPTGSKKLTLNQGSTILYSTDVADQTAPSILAKTLSEALGAVGSCPPASSKTVTVTTTSANSEGTLGTFTAGFYTATIGAANVVDTASTPNGNTAGTAGVTIPDPTTPTVASSAYTGTGSATGPWFLTINYSEKMSNANTGTGAANPANYTLDGSALPAGATVACTFTAPATVNSDCNVVTITFNTKPASGGHIVQVSGSIVDKQGTPIGSNTNVAFTQ